VAVFLIGEDSAVTEDEEQAMLAESRRQQADREAAAKGASLADATQCRAEGPVIVLGSVRGVVAPAGHDHDHAWGGPGSLAAPLVSPALGAHPAGWVGPKDAPQVAAPQGS
jgi:hypothetical protein